MCRKSDKYWICQIRRSVDESAVLDFIERHRPMKNKIAKRICIALEDIDANALLLAKENNIWVWDFKNINELLRLYRKRNLIQKGRAG